MHSQPPVPFTVANFNALDMNAALKWKYKGPCGDLWGWEIGEFQKVTEKGKYKGCYEIQYDDQTVQHWPKDPNSDYYGLVWTSMAQQRSGCCSDLSLGKMRTEF